MVHRENLFDGDVVAGIITALIVMLLFSIYAIISPTTPTTKQIFQPYPTVSPKEIPDAPIGTQKCFKNVNICDPSSPQPGGPCAKCGNLSGSFYCTQPGGPGGTPTLFNGSRLQNNQHYCLPNAEYSFNNKNTDVTVNPLTGVWEWVTSPVFCGTLGDLAVGDQCWRPRCLYPELFANPENGCNTFIGCKPGDGGEGGSLRLTAAGAQDLYNQKKILNKYNAALAIGILFDPIREWTDIKNSVVKNCQVKLTTADLLSQDTYSDLMNEGPYKKTSDGHDYWACACNFDFSRTCDGEGRQGVCKAQEDVSWGQCESHADADSCKSDTNCKFTSLSIFRPPGNSKSCETDFCSSNAKTSAHMRTTDLFTIDSEIGDESVVPPYCVCADSNDWASDTEACQTKNLIQNTIIPYGRRKGLVGENPCTFQDSNGDMTQGWLTKSDSTGAVVHMADFSKSDEEYNIQCCDREMFAGNDNISSCNNSVENPLFTRFCVSRSKVGKPSPSGTCTAGSTAQQDICLIRDENKKTGFCASTLGSYGHQIPGPSSSGGSKICSSDKDCDEVCYTEITSGKVYDPAKPNTNTQWKNAHNCTDGGANEIGIEAINICEGKHCRANCYNSGDPPQCVTPYNVSSPDPKNCNQSSQSTCESNGCRWLGKFGEDCAKINIHSDCGPAGLSEFCSTNPNDPNLEDGTCVLRNGKHACASCNCKTPTMTAPQCTGLDETSKTCTSDNDCSPATSPVHTSPVFGKNYNEQTHFCQIEEGKSSGVCTTYGTCLLNFDVSSGVKASPATGTSPAGSVCTVGSKHGEPCDTGCRPCQSCVGGVCINPAEITTTCSNIHAGPACTLSPACKWDKDNSKCGVDYNSVEPDPFLACIEDGDDGLFRCNTNKALALYPKISWMDLNAPVGSTSSTNNTPNGSVTTEVPDNRIKPPSGNDSFRCRNSQGCQGFRPQVGPLSDSVALTYNNHPKASLLTPFNPAGEFAGLPSCEEIGEKCDGGVCISDPNTDNSPGVCIPFAKPIIRPTGYSSWSDNNATTYMEPEFWDGTGLDSWGMNITTCGEDEAQRGEKCPGNLAWCWNGGGDTKRSQDSKNVMKFGCDNCWYKPGPRVYTKTNGPDGDDIKNNGEAMSACVSYYTKAGCWPPSRPVSGEESIRIPQIVNFVATSDGVEGTQNVTPCLADGTLLGANVAGSGASFWNDKIGINETWGRQTDSNSQSIYDQYSLWEAGVGKTGPLCCSDPKRNIPISGQKTFQEGGGCIGGSTKVKTKRGFMTILDLNIGDFVKTRKGWSKVFYIRDHGFTKIPHLRFIFENGEGFTITDDHLVYDSDNNLKRADELKIGDSIWGSDEKITNILELSDIPLTPCVIEGELFVGDFLISCWSQNKENADKMMKLMKMVEKVIDKMDDKELEILSHKIYETFKAGGKDIAIFTN